MTLTEAVTLAVAELKRSQVLYPAPFHSGHEGWGALCEEVQELFDEIRAKDSGKAAAEAVQVAAMALRYLADLCDYNAAVAHSAPLDLHEWREDTSMDMATYAKLLRVREKLGLLAGKEPTLEEALATAVGWVDAQLTQTTPDV